MGRQSNLATFLRRNDKANSRFSLEISYEAIPCTLYTFKIGSSAKNPCFFAGSLRHLHFRYETNNVTYTRGFVYKWHDSKLRVSRALLYVSFNYVSKPTYLTAYLVVLLSLSGISSGLSFLWWNSAVAFHKGVSKSDEKLFKLSPLAIVCIQNAF